MKFQRFMKFKVYIISVLVRYLNNSRGVFSYSPIYELSRKNVDIRYIYSSIFIIKMEDINHILYMVVDILKKYPNTFLLLFTMFSVLKIYLKLKKILNEKMISKNKKDDKWYNYIYEKNTLSIIYWVVIVMFLILIYPTEIEILQKYITPYFSLTTMDYKIIKIVFSIVANILALYLSWILRDLKWWSIIVTLFGLLWSSLLAIDILIYPGIIQKGSVCLIEVFGLITIFQWITNIIHIFNVPSNQSIQSNIAEDYTPTSKEDMKGKRIIKIAGEEKWFTDNKGYNESRKFPPNNSRLRESITSDDPEFKKLFKYTVKNIPKSDSIQLDSNNQSNSVKDKANTETKPNENNDKEKVKAPIKRTKTGTEITTPGEVMERVNKEREMAKPKYTKDVKRVMAMHKINVHNPGDLSKELVIRRKARQADFIYPLKDTGKEVLRDDDSVKRPQTLKELREELLSRRSIHIKKVEIERSCIDEDTNRAVGESLKKQEDRQVRRNRSYIPHSDNNKNSNIWIIFSSISDNFNSDGLRIVIEYISNNINYFLFFSIMLSCCIIYSKIDEFIRILLHENSSEEYNNKIINNLKCSIIVLSMFLIIFFWPGNILLLNGLYEISNTIIYRTIKFVLALIINLLALYINITTMGLYSWKSFFSFISLFSLTFFIFMVYNESFSKFITNFTHIYYR